MMKLIYKILLIALLPVVFFNCNSDDNPIDQEPEDTIYDLRLSIDKTLHQVYTTDTVFEILQGNGEYMATVSDEDIARVSIKDTTVYVTFIGNGYVNIGISDSKGQSASIPMNIYHESLVSTNYVIFMAKDSSFIMDNVSFGVGGYSVKNKKGGHSKVEVKDDKIIIKGVSHGKTYFDLVDKRGTKSNVEIWVVDFRELVTDRLNIEMIPDQRASVKTLYGDGWYIESYNNKLCEAVIIPVSNTNPSDILQIDTFADVIGSGIIQLKDKEDRVALISIVVANK